MCILLIVVVLAVAIGVAFSQLAGDRPVGQCSLPALKLIAEASIRAQEFDLAGAAGRLETDATRDCAEAQIAAVYLRGLLASRDAYRQGGGDNSMAPVKEAISTLAALAKNQRGPADIARLMLLAAAGAALSERDEMVVFIDFARQRELEQRVARQPGAPMVSALELAGDLWLQVHRFDDAERAYEFAAEQLGYTPRILAGLAKVAAQLKQPARACANYRKLVDWWGRRTASPTEIVDARAYLNQPQCGGPK